jgi:hypothetical protein
MKVTEISSADLGALVAMISAKYVHGEPFMPWEIKSLDEKAIVKQVSRYGRDFWLKHHA